MRHDAGVLVGDISHHRNIPMGNPGGGNVPFLSYVLSLDAEMQPSLRLGVCSTKEHWKIPPVPIHLIEFRSGPTDSQSSNIRYNVQWDNSI